MWQEEIEGKNSKTVIIHCHIILTDAHVFILLLIKAEQENILNILLLLGLLFFSHSVQHPTVCLKLLCKSKRPHGTTQGSPASKDAAWGAVAPWPLTQHS